MSASELKVDIRTSRSATSQAVEVVINGGSHQGLIALLPLVSQPVEAAWQSKAKGTRSDQDRLSTQSGMVMLLDAWIAALYLQENETLPSKPGLNIRRCLGS